MGPKGFEMILGWLNLIIFGPLANGLTFLFKYMMQTVRKNSWSLKIIENLRKAILFSLNEMIVMTVEMGKSGGKENQQTHTIFPKMKGRFPKF